MEMASKGWSLCSASEWLWGSEPMRWRRVFPGRADQVTTARQLAASLFAGTSREEEVAMVVAELASNAVLHTRSGYQGGWFGLEVTLQDVAYIAVTDLGGGCIPTIRSEQPGCEPRVNGRGLLMVSKLALSVGIHGSPDTGHTVWADVDLRSRTATAPAEETPLAS
ncbi:ATP-binding protein [Actinomadura sp. LD22]|uniref:ATP-binding protein n=1 Tax=Actinomadura physcomitrii TaxID=2650748 RepID=A0A6I4MAU1_9ACTN|nr:ATP-binding protein [Actinomadura physcomitrii]MWA02763.1 ATP-binding protein [Actinomadura physcomitrii]